MIIVVAIMIIVVVVVVIVVVIIVGYPPVAYAEAANWAGDTDIIEILQTYTKQWVFQLEKGEENGYLHFQGRLSLKEK